MYGVIGPVILLWVDLRRVRGREADTPSDRSAGLNDTFIIYVALPALFRLTPESLRKATRSRCRGAGPRA